MSDSYRDLHGDAYKEWRDQTTDEFIQLQRRAFLAGFEAAADESQNFRHLRQWLEEQRDSANQQWKETDDTMSRVRGMAFSEVLVKLHEMGCAPKDAAETGTEPADCSIQRHCNECGRRLGAGYLCDECDTVEVHDGE